MLTAALSSLPVLMAGQLSAAPPPPQTPKAQVVVQADPLMVPELPAGIPEARKGYRSVRDRVKGDMAYLEKQLGELYRVQPEGAEIKAGTLRIPKAEADRVKAILEIMQDSGFQRLEREVLTQRAAWQRDMEGQGSAAPGPRPAPKASHGAAEPSQELKGPSALEERSQRIAQAKRMIVGSAEHDLKLLRTDPERQFLFPIKIGGHEMYSEVFVDATAASMNEMAEDAAVRTAAGQITKEHMQGLSDPFDRLVLDLEDSFLKASGLLAVPHDTQLSESSQRLQQALKILLMERLRSCLWFSWQVWADLATGTLPPPLARLAPALPAAPASGTRN